MTTKHFLQKNIFAAIVILCFSEIALAQKTDTTGDGISERILSNVVITGQYSPRKIEDAVQRIRVVDAKKIAAMGAQNLRDVLLNEMNVNVAQDPALGSSVSIQGVTGQNVKILIDGVPVIGRQDGNVDISQMNTYNIERIELVEGPMSVNYGTDALAGTINIITKSTVKGNVDAGINTYTESIGKYNVNANLGFNKGKHTVVLAGSRNFFDGWDPSEGFRYMNFEPTIADGRRSVQWDPKEEYNANLQYSYRLNKATTLRFKSEYFHDIITNRGAPDGFYGYTASDDVYNTFRFNNAVFANGKILKSKNFTFLAAYNKYKRQKNTYATDLLTMDSPLGSSQDQDTSSYSSFNSRATFSNSLNKNKLNYELGYDVNIENGSGRRILSKQQQIGDYAIYGSSEYNITRKLIGRIGLRYAYNTAFTSPVTPSINLKYDILKNLVWRASYAKGFRAPTVKELYFEFKDSNHDIVGNENLTSERADNFSGAINYNFKLNAVRYKVDASGFYNSIENMITLALADAANNRYTYINIENYKTKGVQMNFSGQYKNLNVLLGASYIGRSNRLPSEVNGIPSDYVYTPEIRFNASYELPNYGTTFSLFVKYTGKMPGTGIDNQNNVFLLPINPYTLADATIMKKFLKDRLSLSLGCKNLFDIKNVGFASGVSGGGSGAHQSSSTSISVGTGRTYFLGLGYRFSK
ncbi:MAG: TonB-dependent receptor [Chitinophagaceae bacterium]|jgi:outer membrane receptor for ferrienterochelin and colicins